LTTNLARLPAIESHVGWVFLTFTNISPTHAKLMVILTIALEAGDHEGKK
jgi:hypothetical protein